MPSSLGFPLDSLVERAYDDLHAVATRILLRRGRRSTLQPTLLVHEAYLRLMKARSESWTGRTHFLRTAAMAMRQIASDHARRRRLLTKFCDEASTESRTSSRCDYQSLDLALRKLWDRNQRQCRIVELRFLLGLSVEEVAVIVGVSPVTVKREWRFARCWLAHELRSAEQA